MLTIQNVSKRFGAHQANNDISFTASHGRITGLLGPNGAGKTTMIRMITSIIMPDAGTLTLDGQPVTSLSQNSIGYLPEERGLYKKLTVKEQIVYFAQLKGLSERDALQRATKWLHRMDAADWMPKKIQELSKGMQQKVQFICTVIHDPSLVILDEPFSGLDPVNADLMISVVKELKDAGTTILLSTHQMDQVEKLCDDIVLIDRGTVMLTGSVSEVRSRFRKNRLHVRFDGPASSLSSLEGASVTAASEGRADIVLGDADVHAVLRQLMDRVQIIQFELAEPSLHEIFVETVTNRSRL